MAPKRGRGNEGAPSLSAGQAETRKSLGFALCRIVGAPRITHLSARNQGAPVHSYAILAVTAGAFLLAGFVKGVIGLGLPTVAIGLLGLIMTPAQAAAILVVPSLITNVWQFAAGGGLLPLVRRMWPMLVGICLGTFIGADWLPRDNSGQATLWLGVALVLYAALGLIKMHFQVPPRAELWLGLLMGSLTGAITVATGIFVMPGTPYVQSLEFDRDQLVQALGLSFTVSTITLGAALGYAGEIHMSLAVPSVVALGAALVGMWLGQMCAAGCSEQLSGCASSSACSRSACIWRCAACCDGLVASLFSRPGCDHENRRSLARHERAHARLGRLCRQQNVLRAESADGADRRAAHRYRAACRHAFRRRHARDRQPKGDMAHLPLDYLVNRGVVVDISKHMHDWAVITPEIIEVLRRRHPRRRHPHPAHRLAPAITRASRSRIW